MAAALEQAAEGLEAGELPIGAVVAFEGEILARSRWRSEDGLLAHPELLVLQESGRRGVELVTTLEPCLMCMGAAMSAFAKRVVFALESRTDGASRIAEVWDPAAGFASPYGRPEVIASLRRDASLQLVRTFLERYPESRFAPWARTLVN